MYGRLDVDPVGWASTGSMLEGLLLMFATVGSDHTLQISDHSQSVQGPLQLCLAMHLLSNNLLGKVETQDMIETLFLREGKQLLHVLRSARPHVSKVFIPTLLRTAIEMDNIELANDILLGDDYDPTTLLNNRRERLLEIAVAKGKDEMIWLLLACGADPNLEPLNSWDESPMMIAAQHGRLGALKLLIMFDVGVNPHSTQGYTRALIIAVKRGHLQIVTLLLDAGADVNGCGVDGGSQESYISTPLQIASEKGDIELVRQLLQHGADARASSGTIPTPIEIAASNGQIEIAHLLISYGATLDLDVELSKAARGGDIELIRVLLDYGADINALPPADFQYTALQEAADCGFYNIVQFFIDLGVTIIDPPGRSALVTAAKNGHKNVVQLLMDHGADVNARFQDQTALQVAVFHNNTDIAKLLLEFGADINAPSSSYTALQAAAYNQNFSLVKLFLGHGAEVNAPAGDCFGTVLQAAISGRGTKGTELARLLIVDWGADINARSSRGTVLNIAVSGYIVSAVRLLLRHGVDVHNACELVTPLQTALISPLSWEFWKSYGIRIFDLLLDAGARIDSIRPHHVIPGWDCGKLKFLLDRGLDANTPMDWYSDHEDDSQELYDEQDDEPWDKYRFSLLQAASHKGDVEMVAMLLHNGADVNTPAHRVWGRTALQAAAEYGNEIMVEMLLSHGADVNAEPAATRGRTALQAGASHWDNQIVPMLLKHGADVNAKPAAMYGVTALQAAAIVGNLQVVVTLLEAGADVNASAAPVEGRTAIEGAAEHGRLDTVQLLLNVGAEVKGTRAVEFALAEGHVSVLALLENY